MKTTIGKHNKLNLVILSLNSTSYVYDALSSQTFSFDKIKVFFSNVIMIINNLVNHRKFVVTGFSVIKIVLKISEISNNLCDTYGLSDKVNYERI